MALQLTRSGLPAKEPCLAAASLRGPNRLTQRQTTKLHFSSRLTSVLCTRLLKLRVSALDHGSSNSNSGGGSSNSSSNSSRKGASSSSSSNYVVPLDKSSCITRPLTEILRDLNKRIPDNIIKSTLDNFIPWYHANRMLSFYAPGWCGEIRDVIFSDNGSVTVVYRVTIRGSDGEAHRESTGTVSSSGGHAVDPVAAAEEIAFCRACARFGLGLYLYHDE